MYRKYPVYADDILAGEADLADWLIRKALRKFQLASAAKMFIYLARSNPCFALALLVPSLLSRLPENFSAFRAKCKVCARQNPSRSARQAALR